MFWDGHKELAHALYCANISDLKPIGEADDHCATMAQVLREWINFFLKKKERK